MNDQHQRIDAAVRASRWQSFVADVRGGWWIVGGIAVALSAVVYWFASPRTLVDIVVGAADGMHQQQSETGRGPLRLSAVLEDGSRVSLRLPPGQIYRAGTPIELEVYRRDWPPRAVSYRFIGYADAD